MSTRCGGWIWLVCFSFLSGSAQQNRPMQQFEPPASVQVGGSDHRVTLDVFVSDKSGKPVTGLQERDFTLLDNQRLRKIVSFHAVEGEAATADPPVEVVLVFDEVNAPFEGVAVERVEIEKFLRRGGAQLALPVSLVIFSDAGTVRSGPSRDGNVLIGYLNKNDPGTLRTPKSQGRGVLARKGDLSARQVSLQALARLVADEMTRPGRKVMVWVGPGWPLSSGILTPDQATIFATIVADSSEKSVGEFGLGQLAK